MSYNFFVAFGTLLPCLLLMRPRRPRLSTLSLRALCGLPSVASMFMLREPASRIPSRFNQFRTLLRNGAVPTPLSSIVCALFPIQWRRCTIPREAHLVCSWDTSIFRILFQVPYPLTPLFATLTKTTGVYPISSHSGTKHQPLLATPISNPFSDKLSVARVEGLRQDGFVPRRTAGKAQRRTKCGIAHKAPSAPADHSDAPERISRREERRS